jgi:hypothetical protein
MSVARTVTEVIRQKEDVALEYRAKFEGTEGILLVGKAQSPTHPRKPIRDFKRNIVNLLEICTPMLFPWPCCKPYFK